MEEHVQIFKHAESNKQSERGMSVLPHESQESQCIGGAKVSQVCSSDSTLLIEIAKGLGWQLTVVVFEGESVSPSMSAKRTALMRMALSRFALHTTDKARIGIKKPHVYCCPICAYVINNCTTLLDHIIVGHYWGSSLLREVSSFCYTHTPCGNDGTFNRLWTVRDGAF